MIKKMIHKSVALTMALLMFTTSAGFSLDLHFCQDQLKSIAIFGKSKSCHEMAMSGCKMHKSETSSEKKDCCSNKEVVIESSDTDKIIAQFDHSRNNNLKVHAAYAAILMPLECLAEDASIFIGPSPPLPKSRLHIQFQQFLI